MAITDRKKFYIKLVIIGLLMIFLLVPMAYISWITHERQSRRDEAIREIGSKWASSQMVQGPILTIPYLIKYNDSSNAATKSRNYLYILPENLNISADVVTSKRYRGIYEAVLYNSDINISGNFKDIKSMLPTMINSEILLNEASISLAISDLRGIEDIGKFNFGGRDYEMNPGLKTADFGNSGVHINLKLDSAYLQDSIVNFSGNFKIKGIDSLHFYPIGKTTTASIKSTWRHPSFEGAFLPYQRNISDSGFNANWKILHLNRNYPQSWSNDGYRTADSQFGVYMMLAVDNYTKTDRSIKYAFLIVALTFLVFLFIELMNKNFINPLAYILIGFALVLFYVLLLAFSEYLVFNLAYLIATVMTVGLIMWYSAGILKDKKLSVLIGGNLTMLYGFIYVLLQLQDYSLLAGSLGLFVILALVMHFSKKIDWQRIYQ